MSIRKRWSASVLRAAGCGAISVMSVGVAAAQDVGPLSAPTVVDPRPAGSDKLAPQRPGVRFDLPAPAALPTFALDALDIESLMAEDEQYVNGVILTPLRSGVARPVAVALADLPDGWTEIAGVGRVWQAAFRGDDATALRLHFVDVNLPAGAELWAYSLDAPDMVQGPFVGRGLLGSGEFWTTILGGETVVVEYFVPEKQADTGTFVVDELMHVYRDVLAPLPGEIVSREGTCHRDSSCEPAWHPLRNAVGRCVFVNGAQQDICTGTLLATSSGDLSPYFYTAQHCCPNNAGAQTAVIYWFFQTSVCNGAVPALGSLPTTNVAEMISQRNINLGQDYALIMLRGLLPAGLTWAGWDTANFPIGTRLSSIHHPTGAYKRIMFGNRVAYSAGGTNFWGVIFDDGGTVEFSTSGAPLFKVDTQLFVGQASHVTSSPIGCSNPSNQAGYGRFSTASANFASYLPAGPDDAFDDAAGDDSCAAPAAAILPLNQAGLVVKSLDEDWYRVTLEACHDLSISATYTHTFGDVDIELYDACGGSVVASSLGTTGTETIAFQNASGSPKTVFLRVFLDSNTRNTYDLAMTTAAIAGCTVCVGDINGDSDVNLTDLAIMLSNFGRSGDATAAHGDLNGDAAVNLTDLALLLARFGSSCT